jgi:hypothetical protein
MELRVIRAGRNVLSGRGITVAAISSSIRVGQYSPGVRIGTGPREEFPAPKHRRPEANAWEAEER